MTDKTLTKTLTTEQVEEILAGCREFPHDWIDGGTVSSLATELLVLRKRVEELEEALKDSEGELFEAWRLVSPKEPS